MPRIFISYSSQDRAATAELRRWLEQQGHHSYFIDCDERGGIVGGADWESSLYEQMQRCEAVIALVTPDWLASKWCFGEVVLARAQGKPILPLKLKPCEMIGVLADVQAIDLTRDPAEGYRRLAAGLKARGLDPNELFSWDPSRPPYPGLPAHQEEDAAVFFGRSTEIQEIRETLTRLRSHPKDTPRMVLVIGPSGSGKSSLVRAGVLPRLRKDTDNWRALGPFRPNDPSGPIAALSRCLKAQAGGAVLDPQHPDATTLLVLDQLEELLVGNVATTLLSMLGTALVRCDRLLTIGTLRSDFLSAFQREVGKLEPEARAGLRYVTFVVNPLPVERFSEIIEGPARQVGLTVESGLTAALVHESGYADSLPLLAFVLRRLYDRDVNDTRPERRGCLDLQDYGEIGRLEGAVRTAAEQILIDFAPDAEEVAALRHAFIPGLAQTSDSGRYLKRQARVAELPAAARRLLEAFVEARLLMASTDAAGERTIEIAHEALLRTWPRLANWLAEDRDKLHQHNVLRRAALEWDRNERAQDHLAHRDGRLREAVALVADRRFAFDTDSVEAAYLNACVTDQHEREAAKQAEQERRVNDARRLAEEERSKTQAQATAKRRAQISLAISLVAGASLALLSVWAFSQRNRANAERVVSLSRSLAAHSRLLFDRSGVELQTAALLAAESLQRSRTPEGDAAIRTALSQMLEPVSTVMHPQGVEHVILSNDGKLVASMSRVDEAMLVKVSELQTGKELAERRLPWRASTYLFAFTPDSRYLAISCDESTQVWEWRLSEFPVSIGLAQLYPEHASISGDSRWLAAAVGNDILIYDIAAGTLSRKISVPGADQGSHSLSFSPVDARRIFVGTTDGHIVGVDAASGSTKLLASEAVMTKPATTGAKWTSGRTDVEQIVPSRDGVLLLTVDANQIRSWRVDAAQAHLLSAVDVEDDIEVAFAPSGKHFVASGNDGNATVWDTLTGRALASRILGQSTTAVAFPSEALVLSANAAGTATVWNWRRNEIVGRSLGGAVESLAADDSHFVTAANDGSAHAWKLPARRFGQKQFDEDVTAEAIAPGGRFLAMASNEQLVVTDMQSDQDVVHELGDEVAKDLIFSKDASLLAVAGGSSVAVVDVLGGKIRRRFKLPTSAMDYEDPSDPHRTLRVISIPEEFKSSDFFDGAQETAPIQWHPDAPEDLRARANDKETMLVRRKLRFVTGDPGRQSMQQTGFRNGGFAPVTAFSPGGRRLAAAALGYIWVFDVESGKRVARLTLGKIKGDPSAIAEFKRDITEEDVRDMWFTTDARALVIQTQVGLKRWDLSTSQLTAADGASCYGAEPSASGVIAVVTDTDITVYDKDCKVVGALAFQAWESFMALSPDGSLLATARDLTFQQRAINLGGYNPSTYEVQVRSVKDGSSQLKITIGALATVAEFGADGRYLAVGDSSGRARVFDLADNKQIAQIQHLGSVQSVHFGPDSAELVSQSEDSKRSVLISPLSPDVLVAEVCSRSVRSLNEIEWADYMEGEPVRSICPLLPQAMVR